MRIHKVILTSNGHSRAGFKFFSNIKRARQEAKWWARDNPGESATIHTIDIARTRSDIVAALNVHASHPDNG